MDQQTREDLAEMLLGAYSSGVPVEPLTDQYELAIGDAYEIQLLQVARWTATGARVKGHKVGLTSAAMQRQMNVDQPDYGHLLDRMFWPEAEPIPLPVFLQPRVEPETAFVLAKPLRGPGVTVADAIAAVSFVLPALELIDSRIRDWKIGLADTIADNASSGGVVLGSNPAALSAVDLRLAGCNLHKNGELAGTGASGAVLGSPVKALAWLANTLGARGIELEAGQVILPGSVTAFDPGRPGRHGDRHVRGPGPGDRALRGPGRTAGPGAAPGGEHTMSEWTVDRAASVLLEAEAAHRRHDRRGGRPARHGRGRPLHPPRLAVPALAHCSCPSTLFLPQHTVPAPAHKPGTPGHVGTGQSRLSASGAPCLRSRPAAGS